MKKLLSFLLAALLVSALSGFALADIIWEPNDDFYTSHRDDCEYYARSHYSNDESGYMPIFDRPNGAVLGYAGNGECFHVQFTYSAKDKLWGVVEYSDGADRLVPANYESEVFTGWVDLDQTLLKYDSRSFKEEHAGEIKLFSDDNALTVPEGTTNIVYWSYPLSGEVKNSFDFTQNGFDAPVFNEVYTDAEGRDWGFVSYYYAVRDRWVCISDPANESIDGYLAPELTFFEPLSDTPPEADGNTMTTTIIICVCAAVIISAGLIIGLRRKNKTTDAAE